MLFRSADASRKLFVPEEEELGQVQGCIARRPHGSPSGNLRAGHEAENQFHLDAMAGIAERYPAVTLTVFGDGPEREALHAHARRVGLNPDAIFKAPYTTRQDLTAIMADTDIFVMSSVLEGQPLALVEALAHGRAIVATTVGGIPELIKDGHNGMLCPPQDADALADHVRAVLPRYAIPDRIRVFDQLPTLPSGKIDRQIGRAHV